MSRSNEDGAAKSYPTTDSWTMAQTASLTASLQHYKFPIIALACLAAGATIYYAQNSNPYFKTSIKAQQSLHRSNARHRARRRRSLAVPPESEDRHLPEQIQIPDRGARNQTIDQGGTENDGVSEFSWEGQDDGSEDEEEKDGQSLLYLLFKIAEQRCRTDGYVHRGVACDSCNETPIKGIRYRCVNCDDHDLCETCESTQTHNRQHLFLKVRIPAPQLGTRKEKQPLVYPGKPQALVQDLRKDKLDQFCRETGYKSEEVEALWEQFRSMADHEWPGDPDHYGLAIDRPTFDRCFIPCSSGQFPRPNLIYSRIFSYYDTNDDGLIGVGEFIRGLSSLKKKNRAERMKRVFRAYDINNDGYVDRRDFLRMFTAYYAYVKELMGDIVAAMQDEEDQDTLELINGGQPLSSAFNGPGPVYSRVLYNGGTGKVQNGYGDLELADGMGAVNDQDFNPGAELNAMMSENMIWESGLIWHLPRSCKRFPQSGQAIYNMVTHTPREELDGLMNHYGVRCSVSSSQESLEGLERRSLHAKLAQELFGFRLRSRMAYKRRIQKQTFYQHRQNSQPRTQPSPSEEFTQMEKNLQIISSSDLFIQFDSQVTGKLVALDWPIESSVVALSYRIYAMIRGGFQSTDLIEVMDGFSPDPKEVRGFLSSFEELLSRMAREVEQQPHYKANLEGPSTLTKRRFPEIHIDEQDIAGDDTGDRFRPTNLHSSRHGALDGSNDASRSQGLESEPDFAQEVLFAVTEEALNELLDPVFRLREDLALQALVETEERSKNRAEIIACVATHRSLFAVKNELERYLRRWRQKNNNPPPPPYDDHLETHPFAQFMNQMFNGVTNNVTGKACSECSQNGQTSWVRVGDFCNRRQYHSTTPLDQGEGRRLEDEHTSPAEACPMCALMGEEESWITDLYCNQCGEPCTRLIAEEARLRQFIESGVGSVGPEFGMLDPQLSTEQSPPLDLSPSKGLDGEEMITNSPPREGSYSESEEAGLRNAAQAEQSAVDNLAEDSYQQSMSAKEPTSEYTDTASYPEMAHDLHQSVASFNARDPDRIEAAIASKPLNDLLAESGYTASIEVENICTEPTMPDPTMPQNRPNAVPLPQVSGTLLARDVSCSSSARSSPVESQKSRDMLDQQQAERKNEKKQQRREESERHQGASNPNAEIPADDEDVKVATKSKSTRDTPNCDNNGSGHNPREAIYKYWACLDLIEAEDRERGGPGRINFEEFEEIMQGEKGNALAFLASWVEIGAF